MTNVNTPQATETVVVTETEQGNVVVEKETTENPQTEVPAEDKNVDVETPEEEPKADEELDPKDPKKTFTKLRDERDEAKRTERLAKEKLEKLENELNELKNQELRRNEDWKTLYENQTNELVRVKATNVDFENRVKDFETNSGKTTSELETDLHETIDLLIAAWPESAKSLIDPSDKASARDRKGQLQRAIPVVKDLTNREVFGLPSTPVERKEDENSKKERINSSLDRLGV